MKLLKIVVLIVGLMSFDLSAADGGAIKILNGTNERLDITWSGYGCFGVYNELVSVCASVVLLPNERSTYYYDWGVMATWLNVSNLPTGTAQDPHACSPDYGLNPNRPKKCLFDHRVVGTKSGEVNGCLVTNEEGEGYRMACY